MSGARRVVSLLAVAVGAIVLAGCGPWPPSNPPQPHPGTGCRQLLGTELGPVTQSITWNGSYDGEALHYENLTCADLVLIRWKTFRFGDPTDPEASALEAYDHCIDLAEAVGVEAIIGAYVHRLQNLVASNRGDATGIPADLWICSVPSAATGNWPPA